MCVSHRNDEHYQKIPEFWSACQRNGDYARLCSMDEGSLPGLFGIFHDYDAQSQIGTYSIMVRNEHVKDKVYDEIIIPESTWAIFDCRGPVPQTIQDGWNYLYQEWLIKYPFQHGSNPELEWYSSSNAYDKDYLSQIWIPIIEEE